VLKLAIKLSVGCTWDYEQLLRIIKLNKNHSRDGIQVTSLFGSVRSDVFGLISARPDFRIPDVSINNFIHFVSTAKENGIEISYTFNAPLVRPIKSTYLEKKSIVGAIRRLKQIGINKFVLADPLLFELLEPEGVRLEVSTIIASMNENTLKYYKNFNVEKVCANIYHNRDIVSLKKLQDAAEKLGMYIELLVNEFCMFGSLPCSEIMRTACYNHSAMGGNQRQYFNNWPFKRCQEARKKEPSSWIKAPFILPQHLEIYGQLTGIENFKIAGRTNSVEQVDFLLNIYMGKNYEGNLARLWCDPYNMKHNRLDEFPFSVKDLIESGFFNRWFGGSEVLTEFCGYLCGQPCSWCDDVYEIISANNTQLFQE
jgi:collagenase-like PrtC family protease